MLTFFISRQKRFYIYFVRIKKQNYFDNFYALFHDFSLIQNLLGYFLVLTFKILSPLNNIDFTK